MHQRDPGVIESTWFSDTPVQGSEHMANLLIEGPYSFILLEKQSHRVLLLGGLPLTPS